MSITIATLRTKTLNYINEDSGTPWSSTVLDSTINVAQREIALWLIRHEPSFLVSSTTISRTNGTASYSLPSGFVSVRSVLNGSMMIIPQINHLTREDRTGWYLSGNYIVLQPDTITETVTLEYHTLPDDLSDENTTSVLPDACEDMIAIRAGVILKGMDEEFDAQKALRVLLAEQESMVGNMLFMRDLTGTYKIRNVRRGTYGARKT